MHFDPMFSPGVRKWSEPFIHSTSKGVILDVDDLIPDFTHMATLKMDYRLQQSHFNQGIVLCSRYLHMCKITGRSRC